MAWALDIAAGVVLGLTFFVLVRLRMLVAPWLGRKLGQWARWLMWVVIGLTMITVANLELFGLRLILNEQFGLTSAFFHELLFALIGFGTGFFLITRYVTGRRENQSAADRRPCGARVGNEP